jgi:hypothetical protein
LRGIKLTQEHNVHVANRPTEVETLEASVLRTVVPDHRGVRGDAEIGGTRQGGETRRAKLDRNVLRGVDGEDRVPAEGLLDRAGSRGQAADDSSGGLSRG